MWQDLSQFRIPARFRGRSPIVCQLWWVVQASLFRWSPQFAYGFRVGLVRVFGGTIGKGVKIRPTVTLTYPWKVMIGDYSWIGDDVVLYSLGDIRIGSNTVISQKSYLCAADHDSATLSFPLRARPISVGGQVWIAADVFLGPGVSVADGVIIGARSSVFSDLPPGVIAMGSPATIRSLRPDSHA